VNSMLEIEQKKYLLMK